MSTGGEVANALVCKTSIRGFNSRPVLQNYRFRGSDRSQGRQPSNSPKQQQTSEESA